MSKIEIPQKIKKYFWDIDTDSFDFKKHRAYTIARILELGDESAVAWMNRNFSKREILDVLKKSKHISKRSSNYWDLVLNKKQYGG